MRLNGSGSSHLSLPRRVEQLPLLRVEVARLERFRSNCARLLRCPSTSLYLQKPVSGLSERALGLQPETAPRRCLSLGQAFTRQTKLRAVWPRSKVRPSAG